MYAVIDAGGHQLAVKVGDKILVDRRADRVRGSHLMFDRVFLVQEGERSRIGQPCVDGVVVEGKVLDPEVKGTKIKVQKFRRRRASSKTARGHRQRFTRVEIVRIGAREG
jgi:large subunit ribosomal protein L21